MIENPLHNILEIAQSSKTAFIFDLDSTLFNVSTRTKKILDEFAYLHKKELLAVDIHHSEWGLKEPLERAGYKIENHLDLHTEIRDFWVERFFSNEYLEYDIPTLGAVSFVQRLQNIENCQVYFLTGRDQIRMGLGTVKVLKKWGFIDPSNKNDNFINLKPHRGLEDKSFKTDWVNQKFQLNCSNFDKVYFFENEPVNLNHLGRARNDIELVFIDTTHSRKENLEVPAIKIKNFIV